MDSRGSQNGGAPTRDHIGDRRAHRLNVDLDRGLLAHSEQHAVTSMGDGELNRRIEQSGLSVPPLPAMGAPTIEAQPPGVNADHLAQRPAEVATA